MKRLLFTLLLLASALTTQAANPSFDSFVTNDFIKIPPYIYLRHTNSSGTNVFNNTLIIYTNSTIEYFVTTNFYDNSITIYTNSSVTLNGTNLATINPTIGRIPYNADGTNFLDSSLYYIDPDTVGANELRTDLMVFNPAPTQSLPTGVNLLNPFEVSFMPLAASTTTPTDTQIRLSTGNGVGALLVLQNYNGDAFELLNGDALWDDPAAHVYLSGGDWKPTTIGQAMMLIGTSQGWAEIGRFGGSTNVVTESLWQYSGGYLQPVDLTQPLFWTNSVTWGPGTTNSLERSGLDLIWTNSTTAARFGFGVANGSGQTAYYGTHGNAAEISHGSVIDLISNSKTLRWWNTSLVPLQAASELGHNGGGQYPWGDFKMQGTEYIYGFNPDVSDAANYSRLAISHTGTNGAVVFDSQAAGSAGAPRPIEFSFGGTNAFKIDNSATFPNSSAYFFNGAGTWSLPGTAWESSAYINSAQFSTTNLYQYNVASGYSDLWTVPAGYYAMITGGHTSTTNSTGQIAPGVKISGVYYLFESGFAVTTNNPLSGVQGATSRFVYQPGETIIYTNYTQGTYYSATIRYWPTNATATPNTAKILEATPGATNLLYEVPVGKTASTSAATFTSTGPPLSAKNVNTLRYQMWLVPNGQALGDSTLLVDRTASSNSILTYTLPLLQAGDKIYVCVYSAGAGQNFWINYSEYP